MPLNEIEILLIPNVGLSGKIEKAAKEQDEFWHFFLV